MTGMAAIEDASSLGKYLKNHAEKLMNF